MPHSGTLPAQSSHPDTPTKCPPPCKHIKPTPRPVDHTIERDRSRHDHTQQPAGTPQNGRTATNCLGEPCPPRASSSTAGHQPSCKTRPSPHFRSMKCRSMGPHDDFPQLSPSISLWVPRPPHAALPLGTAAGPTPPGPLLCEGGDPSCWDTRARRGGSGLEADRKPGHPRCWVAAPPPVCQCT